MATPMRLALAITADASGVAPATAEARREVQAVGEQARETSRVQVAANDEAAAAARRATEAIKGQSAAERDLRDAVMRFAGGRTPLNDNEYQRRAADVAAYGDSLDRLRAQYNPLFAVTRQYLQSREQIQQAHRVGAISSDEMTAAISRERQATLASIAAIKGRNAAIADTPFMRGGGFSTGNIAAQFQDIGVTAAMGQSPLQIALQQGTQLSAVLNDVRASGQGAGAAMLAAFTSIINPVSLVTIGVIGLTAAAIQYFSTWMAGSDEAELSLKEQAELVSEVAKRWGDALPSIKAYADERARIAGQQQIEDATAITVDAAWREARVAIQSARIEVANIVDSMRAVDREGVVELQGAFNNLLDRVGKGVTETGDLERVSKSLSDLYDRTQIPIVKELAETFAGLSEQIAKANTTATLARAEKNLRELQNGVGLSPLGTIPPVFSGGGSFIDANGLQSARADAAKSQFQIAQERLARSRSSSVSEAEREAKAVAELIQQLEFENSLIGASAVERERLTALRRAGAAATDEQKEKISQLVTESYAEKEALKQQENAYKTLENVGTTALNGIANALSDGKLEGQELLAIVVQIIQQLANAPGGLSGIGGLFSGLFGGGFNPTAGGFADMLGLAKGGAFVGGDLVPFARGGVVDRPTLFPFAKGTGLMGEAGPEAIMPLARDAQGRLGVSANQSAPVFSVVVNNAPAGTRVREERGKTADGRQLRRAVIDIVNEGEAAGEFDNARGVRFGSRPMTVRR